MFNAKIIFQTLFILAICHLNAADEVGRQTFYAVNKIVRLFDRIIEDVKLPPVDHSCIDNLGDDPTVEQIKKCTDTDNFIEKYLSTLQDEKISENKDHALDILDGIAVYRNKLIEVPYYVHNVWPMEEFMRELTEKFEEIPGL